MSPSASTRADHLASTSFALPAALLLSVITAAPAHATQVPDSYTIVELPGLGGDESEAMGLNDAGVVVGYARLPNGQSRAVRWVGGTVTDLGTLGGNFSIAYDVSDAGRVVGQTEQGGFPTTRFGFRLDPGQTAQTPLANLENLFNGIARTVNAAGQVAGTSASIDSVHPVVWNEAGAVAQLPVLQPQTFPDKDGDVWDSNAANDCVGWTRHFDSGSGFVGRRAVKWPAAAPGGAIVDLGTLGGNGSEARGINDAGQIVGMSGTSAGQTHAFLWQDGAMLDLGDLGDGATAVFSLAHDVNAAGVVVGQSQVAPGSAFSAFIWEAGTMRDLNALIPADSGWVLRRAAAINAQGIIVGQGVAPSGLEAAFVLTPAPDSPWVDLGHGLAGTHGVPALVGGGSLTGGDAVTIDLAQALESSTAFLFIGFAEGHVPFKGGVLVPALSPNGLLVALPTGLLGTIHLQAPWPAGIPAGFALVLQAWVLDPAGPVGLSASNAIKGTAP